MQIGVSRTEPNKSVPMRAVNDRVGAVRRPSRLRNAVRAERPGRNGRSCNGLVAGASAAVSGRIVSASALVALQSPYEALPLSISTDSGPLAVAIDVAKD